MAVNYDFQGDILNYVTYVTLYISNVIGGQNDCSIFRKFVTNNLNL